jgi:hypothetical protein
MMTSKDQEINSGISTDRKELLKITHSMIKQALQTCLKTLLQKNRGKILMKKKSML